MVQQSCQASMIAKCSVEHEDLGIQLLGILDHLQVDIDFTKFLT